MVIGKRRTPGFVLRVLAHVIHQKLHGLFQLRIVALPPRGRIELDFDVGRDAVVLNLPFSVEPEYRRVWGGHIASIHQRRQPESGHKTAPGSLADKGPNLSLLEIPRHSIAA